MQTNTHLSNKPLENNYIKLLYSELRNGRRQMNFVWYDFYYHGPTSFLLPCYGNATRLATFC